jgi:nitrite reductase/ring-hydroxylating ferredoxin subunit
MLSVTINTSLQLLSQNTAKFLLWFHRFEKSCFKPVVLCGQLNMSNTRETVVTVTSELTNRRTNQRPASAACGRCQHKTCVPPCSADHTSTTPHRHCAGPSHAASYDLTAGSLQQGDTDRRPCHAISIFISHTQYNVFCTEQANVTKGDEAVREKTLDQLDSAYEAQRNRYNLVELS